MRYVASSSAGRSLSDPSYGRSAGAFFLRPAGRFAWLPTAARSRQKDQSHQQGKLRKNCIALKSFAIEMRRTGSAKHESRSAFRTLGLANARRHFVCFGHHANGPFEARIPTPPHLLELAERRPAASRVHQKKAYQRYLAPVRY